MPTPSIQTLRADAQQVLNLDSISAVRSVVAATLANANAGTPLNPNLTTQQLWNEFYQIVTQPKSDIESIIANQLMKFLYAPPAPGGVGADKQVIFNDGGVLAGDPQFLWNKTTNLLTVTGSATITGDLTVSKNTNGQNRLILSNPNTGTGAYDSIDFTAGTANNQILSMGSGYSGSFPYLTGALLLRSAQANGIVLNTAGSAAAIQFGINDTLAMTLNATGLGVGVTPAAARIQAAASALAAVPAAGATGHMLAVGSTPYGLAAGALTNGNSYIQATRWDGTATNYDLMIQPNGGNVGIGVTPPSGNSAGLGVGTLGSSRQLQLSMFGSYARLREWDATNTVALVTNINIDNGIDNNAIPSWKVQLGAGLDVFRVQRAAAGSSTFATLATLDASGNLLVAKTASGFTVAGAEIRSNGEVLQTIAASTDATIVSKVYSSTAAAYRFYVGLGGTVFATNTTISAISDARLKENVQDIDVGLGAILALKPRKFDWKEGKGKNIKGDRGFIAQEFEQVFPQLVDQWADEAPEGEVPYKSVRQDLIPVLVKAIQELTARVQTLETR